MSDRSRAFFISLSILALVLFSAFGTIPVYADDGTTSGSTETTTTGTDPVVTETPTTTETDPAATEQPASDPTTVSETQQPLADGTTPTTETTTESITTPLLEQVPDNTTVTVVSETGEAQPLVSQDSADAVLLSDPIWCPAGQVPTPGANGCTQSYSSFTQLLDFLKANEGNAAYQQDGTIYVQQGAYAGGEQSIDFNSYNFTEINKKNLTVTGGWNTTTNEVNSTSSFNVPIIIGSSNNPWGGSVTLNNIIINGAADQTGLTLYSNNNIALSNVEVTNSQNGAEINAKGNVTINNSKFHQNKEKGADIDAGGNVNVSNSDFSNNGSGDVGDPTGSGLSVKSAGAVTLMDVAANNNQLFGSDIQAGGAVTITRGFFNGNQGIVYAYNWTYKGYGLQVVTTGDISLFDVVANNNYVFGASLSGANVTIGEKELVTKSTFNDNGYGHDEIGSGLTVNSTGAVSLYNVEANKNNLYGADIHANGTVSITKGLFNGNQGYYWWGDKTYFGYGLQVTTSDFVNLADVTATGNYLFGTKLNGLSVAIANGDFSSNGTGSQYDILGSGLEITAINNVTLFNVASNNNQVFGAKIQAGGDVSISDGFFSGTKVYSYSCGGKKTTVGGGYGLLIITKGDIALNNIQANNNYLYGADLTGKGFVINNVSFNNNGSDAIDNPVGSGAKIKGTGSVTINSIQASNNQLFGLDIETSGNVTISSGTFNNTQSLSLDTREWFGYGLTVKTLGTIDVDNVVANYNYLWGGKLEGAFTSVTNSKFNFNITPSTMFIDDTGLLITSTDEVRLNNVEARENRLIGASIVAAGNVFINQSNFSDNQGIICSISWCPAGSEIYQGYGLSVVTPGLISLDSVTASNNYLFGASLKGSNVTVANSTFNNNSTGNNKSPQGKGLDIESSGPVLILWTTVNNNQNYGANIKANGDVTIVTSTFSGNYHTVGTSPVGYGLQVVTLGNITLDADNSGVGVQSNQNGTGVILQGNNITVNNGSFLNNGSGDGLTINASGTVTLTNVTASGNKQDGVDVTTPACAVVQVNNGTFTNNAQYGLSVTGGVLSTTGIQTFGGNGVDNIFQNPATCAIVLSMGTSSTTGTVVTSPSTPSTTVSSGTQTNNTTVTPDNKKTKVKKAVVKKHKVAKHHGRRGR